jgi:hypothetical protein
MVAPTDRHDDDPIPRPDAQVTLLSQSDGRPYLATVRTWRSCPAERTSSAQVTVSAGAARRLAANAVWVSVPTKGHGYAVYAGVAHLVDDTALDLNGLVPLALEERRRHAPRTPATLDVTVTSGHRPARHVHAIDLSRGGVRLDLREQSELLLGEFVVLDLQLERGPKVSLRGEVTRVDEGAGQAVVQFNRPGSEQRTQIDRYVLLRLADCGPHPTPARRT